MGARALSMRMLAALVAATVSLVFWCESALAASAPTVAEESVTNVATGEVDFQARINPKGASTTVHVEYGVNEAYGHSTPETASVGSDEAGHLVVVHVLGLAPATTYHFHFVATSSEGATGGSDATFTTYSRPTTSGGCSNEVRREEQNALYLPDCRGYEMVTPLDKNGSDITGDGSLTMASAGGNAVSFSSRAGFAGTNGSGDFGFTQYLASREPDGQWASKGITPTPSPEAFQFLIGSTTVVATAGDMRHAIVESYTLPGDEEGIPKGFNYYLEDLRTGAQQVVTPDLGEEPIFPFAAAGALRGYSADMGVISLETLFFPLLPGMPEFTPGMYEWNHGVLKVAGVLPNGTLPPEGSVAARRPGAFEILPNAGTVSADGSKIAFVTPENGQLYLRRNGTSTAWISQSEASSPVATPSKVRFWQMTPDGKKVVFTSGSPLTNSDPGGAGVGLYVYIDGPDPASETNLEFITRIGEGGNIVGGISEDAKRIYFYTDGETSALPLKGTYLWDEGTIKRIAPALMWSLSGEPIMQVTPDGRRAVGLSNEELVPGGKRLQAYVYDEDSETLRCASCMPTGQESLSGVEVTPRATKSAGTLALPEVPSFISRDGKHVFFTTADPLVARDVNGVADTYEYDIESGIVLLLSPGTEQHGAWMASDSVSGEDVFVVTQDQLLGSDTDTLADLYDVRVNGGVAQSLPQTGSCQGDECQGVPSAVPSFNTASGFAGLGNVVHGSNGATKPKSLTRAQKLASALKRCKRRPEKVRKRCIAQAKRRYGSHESHKSTSGKARR